MSQPNFPDKEEQQKQKERQTGGREIYPDDADVGQNRKKNPQAEDTEDWRNKAPTEEADKTVPRIR